MCLTTLGALPKHFFGVDVLSRPGQPQLSNLTNHTQTNKQASKQTNKQTQHNTTKQTKQTNKQTNKQNQTKPNTTKQNQTKPNQTKQNKTQHNTPHTHTHTNVVAHKKLLRTDSFAQRSSHSENPLHRAALTRRRFYTEQLFDTVAISQRSYTHTDAFEQRHFYAEQILHANTPATRNSRQAARHS